MPYVTIEGYSCGRCGYCWTSRNGTEFRDGNDPGHCPRCKSPYWNKRRKNNLPKEKRATRWERPVKARVKAA